MLYTKLQSVNITRGARVANASVLFPAKTPRYPVGLSKGRTLAVVLLLGLLLAVGMAALIDRLDDRVFSEEDARIVSRLPVLAQIPFVNEQDELCLPADTSEGISNGSPLLESFRMLRTMIAYSPAEKVTRSVVVTSSLPHEGKSVSSVNLAIAAAMSGESVILIDCDLRDPAIHRLLDLPNELGFTSVTDGSTSLLDALQETKVAGLRVLTSGPSVDNPFKLLKSGSARDCLRQAMGQADLVVIDSPPALILADAQILSTLADGTLMVISTQEASKREIARTRDLLVQTGARVIGAVLNKSTPDLGGYPNYYYNGPTPPTNQSLAQARKLLFER
jgi:succinoglycan biosynthesis transport protein ExoP